MFLALENLVPIIRNCGAVFQKDVQVGQMHLHNNNLRCSHRCAEFDCWGGGVSGEHAGGVCRGRSTWGTALLQTT